MVDYDQNYRLRTSYARKRGQKIYRIAQVLTLNPELYMYRLKQLDGKPIKGTFYGRELVRSDLKNLKVEKVLKTRKLPDGRSKYLVRYQGYDS